MSGCFSRTTIGLLLILGLQAAAALATEPTPSARDQGVEYINIRNDHYFLDRPVPVEGELGSIINRSRVKSRGSRVPAALRALS
jgi:hypothetical protein